jgi:transposase
METLPPLPSDIWGRTPPEARAYIETLIARVAALEAAVKELTERLQQDSTNSSRPPSSDRPSKKGLQKRRKPSGRRPGGQPGHPGHTRELILVEDVDRVVVLKPVSCGRCDHELSGTDPQPHRHQVIDIAPMRPVVHEYQVHRLNCEGCGATTYGSWPQGVPTSMIGPRAQAIVALCTGAYRLSKRTTQQVLAELFGLSLSVGTISKLESATTALLEAPLEEARAYVQDQASAHLDETGWRQGHKRAWLWVAATTWVTVFLVRLSRGSQVAKELLGERFSGILVTDRWSAYNWYPMRWRQLCWAHLLRDFEAMIGRGGRSQEIGEGLKSQAEQMFHWWHRVRDGTLARSSFRSYMTPVRREVERLLEAGSCCEEAKTEGMCRDILTRHQALWTFVHLEGIEPTNNNGERAIRSGVLWRKISFGSHSAQGSRFVETILSVVMTLKQQQRNVLDYLTVACQAALCNEPAPSLLPQEQAAPSDQAAA